VIIGDFYSRLTTRLIPEDANVRRLKAEKLYSTRSISFRLLLARRLRLHITIEVATAILTPQGCFQSSYVSDGTLNILIEG